MIEVRDVVKKFDGFAALDGASLSVPTGSVYGLVGPNGAGKSTIIRHLTGIYRQDEGTVAIGGEDVCLGERGPEKPHRGHSRRLVLFQPGQHPGHDALLQGLLPQFLHGAL